MKTFYVYSDLHLEFADSICNDILELFDIESTEIKDNKNYLILAGDITNTIKISHYNNLFDYISPKFEKIFFIAGNHEYYGCTNISDTNNQLSEISKKYKNVYFLNNSFYELDDCIIVGSTLWSDIDDSVKLNDFVCIKNDSTQFTHNEYKNLHFESVKYLNETLQNQKKPVIMLTHHFPTFKMIDPMYYKYKILNTGFYSNLDYLIKNPIKYWISGHSHTTITKEYNGVHLICNALGYFTRFNCRENTKFIKFCKFII